MVCVAHEMELAHLDIPIMIGGATTSEMHVALKVAPVYDGPVVWMKDASQNSLAAARLLNREEREAYKAELDHRYDELRKSYHDEQQRLLSIDDARRQKLSLFDCHSDKK